LKALQALIWLTYSFESKSITDAFIREIEKGKSDALPPWPFKGANYTFNPIPCVLTSFAAIFRELSRRVKATPGFADVTLDLFFQLCYMQPSKAELSILFDAWKTIMTFGPEARRKVLEVLPISASSLIYLTIFCLEHF
jgi:hypothetical protein